MSLKEISFFDCNSWVGQNYLKRQYSIEDNLINKVIEDRLNNYNIKANILSHHASLFYWPREGNNLLSNLIKSNPKIFGCMLMEHEFISNPGDFESSLKRRYKEGFRILKLFPKSNKYPFEVNLFSKFYKIMNHYKFPVMIGLEEIDITGNKYIEWDKIADIAKEFQYMPIIIDGQNAKSLLFNSFFLSLLKNYGNIYLTAHNLFCVNQIENIVKSTSSKKILFDTYYPYMEINLSVKRLIYSSLPLEDKKRIAYKNIEEIIGKIEF